jgi:hypothetical protein
MIVIVGLKKVNPREIQVSVARPRHRPRSVQNFSSQQARRVLRDLGLGPDATEYYLVKLLPHVSENQQLQFPPIDISERRLLLLGFKLARETVVPVGRSL